MIKTPHNPDSLVKALLLSAILAILSAFMAGCGGHRLTDEQRHAAAVNQAIILVECEAIQRGADPVQRSQVIAQQARATLHVLDAEVQP